MAQHIKTDGSVHEVRPANGSVFTLKELQAFVGGSIELVCTSDGQDMYVNEEGLLDDLPFNPTASLLAGQHIVGDVIVCTRQEAGG
jgi:hypothetical protein